MYLLSDVLLEKVCTHKTFIVLFGFISCFYCFPNFLLLWSKPPDLSVYEELKKGTQSALGDKVVMLFNAFANDQFADWCNYPNTWLLVDIIESIQVFLY
jgi:hypothetical protein